jgi:hypothetical protein
MKSYRSGPVLPLIWLALDGASAFFLHAFFSRNLEFYGMFLAAVTITSWGAFIGLEHRLSRAGWEDPVVRLWSRLLPQHSAPTAALDATMASFGVAQDQVRRYCEFIDRLKASYGPKTDFDANIEVEFSHFQPNGKVVVNMYAKTSLGEAMIGMLKERLG